MHRRLEVDCDGKTSREILETLLAEVAPPRNGRRIVLGIDHLDRVQDSLSRLLRKLLQFFNEREIKASIIDPSGCAATMYEALGGSVHVEVCRSEEDVSEPKEILVVEDVEDSLEWVSTLLEQAGHHVSRARTGHEAIKLCEARTFDLVLLDLVLPDLDGIQVARAIADRKAPIVAMSAYLDRWTERDYEYAGFRRRLRKPFKVGDLLDALRA
jgi:CheY-like chemotaxis protein